MKSLAHSLALYLSLASPWSLAAGADPSLVGCWRAVKIVQYYNDGTQAEDVSGRCTLAFGEEQFESICASANGTVVSTYRYRIERPNFYLATMAGSTFRTSLIGSTREYEYHVDGDRLSTGAQLAVTEPAAAVAAVRVGTEAVRTACQRDSSPIPPSPRSP